jgi:hypothetical protein
MTIAVVCAVLLAAGLPRAGSSQQWVNVKVVVTMGAQSWSYTSEQLRGFATRTHTSMRGTKEAPAVPLDLLLTKDTGLTADRIIEIAVIAEQDVLLLEGDNLAQLKHVWLRIGPNHLTLVPENDEAYKALRSVWRKPRLIAVERIAIQRRETRRTPQGG